MGERQKKTELFDQIARVGKAIGNGKRLELLDLLVQGERSVEKLAAAADLGLTTASAHLQVLRQTGLVTTRREGTKIYYRVVGLDVVGLYEQLRTVATDRVADVRRARDDYLGLDPTAVTDDIAETSREELLSKAADGQVTVIDVRPREEYESAHIPGALSLPLDELAERLHDLPEDQEVVAYCRGTFCVLAYEAVKFLHERGMRARRLQDGMLEWHLSGLPVEHGQAA